MNYFDLHCDTATFLFDRGEDLSSSSAHISSRSILQFEKYGQVAAIFSRNDLSDEECYTRFFSAANDFKVKNSISFCRSAGELSENERAYILSVEDARLLSGDAERLNALFNADVRVITPLWAGETCIGGSFDTEAGLTRFGKDVINKCLELGVIVDISHASGRSSDEMIDICSKYGAPVIASHSDSYAVNPHARNINDERAKKIASSKGLIGICLHAPHIGDGSVDCSFVMRHIDHLLSVTGEDHVAIGADFDGTDTLPDGINGQRDIEKIANEMTKLNYSEKLINKIFYDNAYGFFSENLGKARKIK